MLEEIARDEYIQLWILMWVFIGVFANYLRIKKINETEITLRAVFKKIIVSVIAWGLFLVASPGIWEQGHIEVILPALTFGILGEIVVGGFLQQKLENYI